MPMDNAPLLNLRQVYVLSRTGIDPRRYRYVCAPGEGQAIRDALMGMGVRESELDLFMIHESIVVDDGQVMIMDLEKIMQPLHNLREVQDLDLCKPYIPPAHPVRDNSDPGLVDDLLGSSGS